MGTSMPAPAEGYATNDVASPPAFYPKRSTTHRLGTPIGFAIPSGDSCPRNRLVQAHQEERFVTRAEHPLTIRQ
jgi:hypothetical protein